MSNVVKMPNEKPAIYGTCPCGHDEWKLRLNFGDATTVTHIKCANTACSIEIPLELGTEIEILCDVDD